MSGFTVKVTVVMVMSASNLDVLTSLAYSSCCRPLHSSHSSPCVIN